MMMLQLNNLSKRYLTEEIETTALNNINLHVEAGEFISIMGPSGCGKSTMLNILGLLDNPSEGSYIFNDVDVTGFSEKQRTKLRRGNIGFVFQSFNLIDELTVQKNIELPLYYMKMAVKERNQLSEQIMELLDINQRKSHYPRQLSGGQQQRVAIARAVVANPSLILADEPTGNLDSSNGDEVMKYLHRLNDNGSTIIMVTHSEEQAKQAKRIVQLFDGKMLTENILAAVS
jgi:putative ABC transport system ATP-binding protein